MPAISTLPVWLQATLRLYPWRVVRPVPCARLGRSLSESRVAIVSTAGLVPAGEAPFDEGLRGGDYSYRVISGATDVASLGDYHRSESFDHAGIEADRNLGLPLDRLRELAADGVVGEVAPRHLSFMGSITAPGRLVRETAPESVSLLVADGVDVALLVPV